MNSARAVARSLGFSFEIYMFYSLARATLWPKSGSENTRKKVQLFLWLLSDLDVLRDGAPRLRKLSRELFKAEAMRAILKKMHTWVCVCGGDKGG